MRITSPAGPASQMRITSPAGPASPVRKKIQGNAIFLFTSTMEPCSIQTMICDKDKSKYKP
jgi:hypothetical protein